jgi:hypothetical protein
MFQGIGSFENLSMQAQNESERVESIRKAKMEAAFKVNLDATFAYLSQFAKPLKGTIGSEVPILDGVEITFEKVSRAFAFSTGPLKWIGSFNQYEASAFGFGKPFAIAWQDKTLFAENRGGRNTAKPGQNFASSGELHDLRFLTGAGDIYFRAIMPLNSMMKRPTGYMKGVDFCYGDKYRPCGMYHLTLDDQPFHFFEYEWESQHYLFFDSGLAMGLDRFRVYLDAVLAGYAFISGSYVKDEVWVLESASPVFDNIIGFSWERLDDSVDGWEEILAPLLYKQVNNLDTRPWLGDQVFEKLIQISLADKRILRAIKLIAEARGIKTELAAASYCVALETISSILVKESYEKLKPIKDDKQRDLLIERLKMVVKDWEDSNFNDKAAVLKKIENIGQVGNNDKFFKSFELKKIFLTKDEEDFLKKRNSYLHGDVPFKNENPKDPDQFELKKISLHIHMLTCALILKMAGYIGPIVNFWKYWEWRRGEIKEPIEVFRDI